MLHMYQEPFSFPALSIHGYISLVFSAQALSWLSCHYKHMNMNRQMLVQIEVKSYSKNNQQSRHI